MSLKKDPGVLKQAINEDAIPVRAKYLLRRLGIRTYDQLQSTSEEELLSHRNFGRESLKGLKFHLTGKGIILRKF